MKQQINLLTANRPTSPRYFSGRSILAILLIIWSATLGFAAYQRWRTETYQKELVELQKKRDEQTVHLNQTIQRFPPNPGDPALKTRMETLKTERLTKLQLVELLVDNPFPPEKSGFSGHLKSLSQQHREGMWLSYILLKRGGQEIELRGGAENANHVPQFLVRLAQEPAFAGKKFTKFEITNVTKPALLASASPDGSSTNRPTSDRPEPSWIEFLLVSEKQEIPSPVVKASSQEGKEKQDSDPTALLNKGMNPNVISDLLKTILNR